MRRPILLATFALSGGLVAASGQRGKQSPAAKPPSSAAQEAMLSAGKKIFIERCASCHNEAGDKPLSPGLPLSQRRISLEQITRGVSGRLKSAPDEQKRAVALYISSFMKNN